LDRALRRVPRRVAVAGTRGKSSVTRLVASGLRASGARVLAKTTGSRPVLIFPDGSEREIARAGPASIREQIRLVGLAASAGVDTLVAEMMSIGAECLAAESRSILRPVTLAVTNVRLDHVEEMGRERAAIARTLASAFPRRAGVFIPEEEVFPVFEEEAVRTGSGLHPVARTAGAGDGPVETRRRHLGEFEPNLRLARAVLGSLGIDGPAVERGLAAAAPDPGSLRIWRLSLGDPPRKALFISLFAANEPESSAAALLMAREAVPFAGRPLVGILSLREDRGDRTLQWIRAAGEGFFRSFASVVLIGPPSGAALRKIRRSPATDGPVFSRAGTRSPEELTRHVISLTPGEPIVVGLGNFVGPGDALVRYWGRSGTEHDR
jgi:poly-gamma-glutamate synthase PgsB/CapB